MTISLAEIIAFLDKDIIAIDGQNFNTQIKYLKSPPNIDEFTLDWINPIRKDKQHIAESSAAKAILVDTTVEYTNKIKSQQKVLVRVSNPKLAVAKTGNHFFVQKPIIGIHPSASIHEKAKIGNNSSIGANAVIGNCTIGDNVIVYPNVVIHDEVIIGNNCKFKSGCILGFEGFGFEKDELGNLIKFPQLGKLIISDNVEVGSNTCIDKGALTDTEIGQGTKINNLCHIAHNVKIGQSVIVTAHVNISGSTTIEDEVWIAPNASLRGHQTIRKGATVGTGAVVTKDIPENETWVGNPARKLGR